MPYYAWQGVRLDGSLCKGKLFAAHERELDTKLFKQRIALLKCAAMRRPLLSRSVRSKDIISLFRQVGSLVKSGILVADALQVVGMQQMSLATQYMLHEIASAVDEGASLSSVLKRYPLCGNQIGHYIAVGEEVGNLGKALILISRYLERQHRFKAQIRKAFIVPAVTFFFFVGVLLLLFLWMIPYFAHTMHAMGKQLPSATRTLLAISDGVKHYGLLSGVGFFVGYGMWRIGVKQTHKQTLFYLIPGVNHALKEQFLTHFFQSMALLLKGGIMLDQALLLTIDSLSESKNKLMLKDIQEQVIHGHSLRNACSHYPWFFSSDILSLLEIGQESGAMPRMLIRLSHIYEDKLMQRLRVITTLIHPLLMLLLGVMVLILILGVYLPIFNLSDAI